MVTRRRSPSRSDIPRDQPGLDGLVLTRRQLAASMLAAVAVGCASGGEDGGGSTTTARRRVSAAETPNEDVPDNIFSLGVASGDPLVDRVMIWTRLASDPLAENAGVLGVLPATIEVAYDMATDADFSKLVASGIAKATEQFAYSVHVDVTGLDPASEYFYRFRVGNQTSTAGRTRTSPAEDAEVSDLRFVYASCQDYQWGRYGAWRQVAKLEPELVIFLGDYIYELTLPDLSPEQDESRVWKSPIPAKLSEYRWRYAQTKSDPDLQAAHAVCPWSITWDDHEVANNYAGDVGQADIDQPKSHDRRLAAYQAWWENQPVRLEEVAFEEMHIYRELKMGSLANIFTLDARQFADPPACRAPEASLLESGPLCEAAEGDRTVLGATQEKWLFDGLDASRSTWTVLASPTMVAATNIATPEAPEYERDLWVGYPEARERLVAALDGVQDTTPVVVSGDWHASFVTNAGDERRPIAEFVGPAISSVPFPEDYSAANPDMKYFAANNGFVLVEVSADAFDVEFWNMNDRWAKDPTFEQARFRVPVTERVAEKA